MERLTAKELAHEWRSLPLQCLEREARELPPFKDDDKLVGEAPEEFRQMLTLASCYEQAARNFWARHQVSGKEDDCRAARHNEAFCEALEKMAWILLREHFGLWSRDSAEIRVCEGWQIVIPKEKMPLFEATVTIIKPAKRG